MTKNLAKMIRNKKNEPDRNLAVDSAEDERLVNIDSVFEVSNVTIITAK